MSTEHDQATVSSPTEQYHSEKFPQQQPTARKSTKGGILGTIGANPLITYGLRLAQLVFSIIALALASRSLNKFYTSERRMRFTAFVGTLTLIYLIVLGLIALFKQSFLMTGPIMIMEALLAIFWLCAFIATAARYSQFSCKIRQYSGYPHYGNSTHIRGCRSGKAAVAFAAFSFLLFALTTALLFFNVVRRLLARNKRNSIFQFGSQSGVKLNKSALAFSKHYDVDADVQGDSTYGHKYSGSHDAESGNYGDTNTYTNEGTTQTGGYNTRTGNEAGHDNSNYGTNEGYNQQTTGNADGTGQFGSNISYPENSYQKTTN